jgi:hypothetical protein
MSLRMYSPPEGLWFISFRLPCLAIAESDGRSTKRNKKETLCELCDSSAAGGE